MNFWETLPRTLPAGRQAFLCLAPMEDVTDTVFRQMVAGAGKPEVFFTEFVNVEGMDSPGRDEVTRRLRYSEAERPIVAQIWGLEPSKFYEAAKVIKTLRFDGIDINFGCPVKDVIKKGACAAMIDSRYRTQVREIIAAVKQGVKSLPVSVKTRIGVKKVVTEDWIGFLLGLDLAAITVHGRTAAEKSEVPAHWEEIGKAVSLRNQFKSKTIIVGNGDVESRAEAEEKARRYGVDGVMIGRGIFKNPWVFDSLSNQSKSKKEKLEMLVEHARLWDQTWGETRNFAAMKKFVKIYVQGFAGAADLRAKLMRAGGAKELIKWPAV